MLSAPENERWLKTAVLKNLASPASRYLPVLRLGFAKAEEYALGHRAPCKQVGPGVGVAVAPLSAIGCEHFVGFATARCGGKENHVTVTSKIA